MVIDPPYTGVLAAAADVVCVTDVIIVVGVVTVADVVFVVDVALVDVIVVVLFEQALNTRATTNSKLSPR
jgi:hypothetical protein